VEAPSVSSHLAFLMTQGLEPFTGERLPWL